MSIIWIPSSVEDVTKAYVVESITNVFTFFAPLNSVNPFTPSVSASVASFWIVVKLIKRDSEILTFVLVGGSFATYQERASTNFSSPSNISIGPSGYSSGKTSGTEYE